MNACALPVTAIAHDAPLDPPDRDGAQQFIDVMPEWLRNEYAGEFVDAMHADEFDDYLRGRYDEIRQGAREP